MDQLLRQSASAIVDVGPIIGANDTPYVTNNLTNADFLLSKNGVDSALHTPTTAAPHFAGDVQGMFHVQLDPEDVDLTGRLMVSPNKATLAGPAARYTVLPGTTFDALGAAAAGDEGGFAILDAELNVPANIRGLNGSAIAAQALAARCYSAIADAVVVVADSATSTGRAANLRTAYAAACALTPGGNALAKNNRATVLIPPGIYDFGTGDGSNHGLVLNTQFVDLRGMTGDYRDVVLTSAIATASRGTVEQTADDVRADNLTLVNSNSTYNTASNSTDPCAYFPATTLSETRWTNCNFSRATDEDHAHGMRWGVTYSGTFTDCICGNKGFGRNGTASGTFLRCKGEMHCFGSGTGAGASGIFIECEAEESSFGTGGSSGGAYIRCIGGDGSFAGTGNTRIIDCRNYDDASFGAVATAADQELQATLENQELQATAESVWQYAQRTLNGVGGGTGPTASAAVADILGQAFRDSSRTQYARVWLPSGVDITQAALDAIAYTLYAVDTGDADLWTPVEGHEDVSVTIADTVFDTLQTDAAASSYNFRHELDISEHAAFEHVGVTYLLVYTITPTSGQPITLRYRLQCI